MSTASEAYGYMDHGAQRAFDPQIRFYDIYERHADGSVEWISAVLGRDQAKAHLSVLALHIANEVFIMDMYEDKVIARKNAVKNR
jgi:hypothetical protein